MTSHWFTSGTKVFHHLSRPQLGPSRMARQTHLVHASRVADRLEYVNVAVIEAFSVEVEERERQRQACKEPPHEKPEHVTLSWHLPSSSSSFSLSPASNVFYKHLQTARCAVPAVMAASRLPRISSACPKHVEARVCRHRSSSGPPEERR